MSTNSKTISALFEKLVTAARNDPHVKEEAELIVAMLELARIALIDLNRIADATENAHPKPMLGDRG